MINNFFSSFRFARISDQGKHRQNNEDAHLCLNEDGAYFVADGMGGGESGEVASHIAVQCLQRNMYGTGCESPGERKQCLFSALNSAHKKIHEYILAHHYRSMGTTIAGIIFNSWNYPSALLCHAGDSRIYRVRHDNLEKLTVDHTLENDPMFMQQKPDEKYAGMLTHAIGMKGSLRVVFEDIDLQAGDIFLLCTDGLSRTLQHESIQKIAVTAEFKEIPQKLIQAVTDADGKDNTTVIAIQIPDVIPAIKKMSDVDIAESRYLEDLTEREKEK